ncbi:MAG: type II toxin-antitoxin system RelE/ParE family toxin [Tepidisphaeraceae bacterium]
MTIPAHEWPGSARGWQRQSVTSPLVDSSLLRNSGGSIDPYDLILAADAGRFFEHADANLQRRLDRCFSVLRSDPRKHNNIKRLKGDFSHLLRYRIGDWRVVYRIEDAARRVVVVNIAHRRDVYE